MAQRSKKVSIPTGMPRTEVLSRLNDLRRNPKFGAPIMTAFHKRKPEESSDEDLRMLLEDIEELRALQEPNKGDKDE